MMTEREIMARPPAIETETDFYLALNIESVNLTDDQFLQLCRDNPDFRLEISAEKELIIMPPTGNETSHRNADIICQLVNWAKRDGAGVAFDNNGMFTLANGAKRSPDAAWILNTRWNSRSKEDREGFTKICPDFVVELRSRSDRLSRIKKKMEEYIANGARLGWLLDPIHNQAYIYRPDQAAECIDDPAIISGDPVLPGFKFDFREIRD